MGLFILLTLEFLSAGAGLRAYPGEELSERLLIEEICGARTGEW